MFNVTGGNIQQTYLASQISKSLMSRSLLLYKLMDTRIITALFDRARERESACMVIDEADCAPPRPYDDKLLRYIVEERKQVCSLIF